MKELNKWSRTANRATVVICTLGSEVVTSKTTNFFISMSVQLLKEAECYGLISKCTGGTAGCGGDCGRDR